VEEDKQLQTFYHFEEIGRDLPKSGRRLVKCVPRCVFVDSSPDLHPELEEARLGGFYSDVSFIALPQGNDIHGMGKQYMLYKSVPSVKESIFRRILEVTGDPNQANGLILIYSLGGQTGSGVGSAILEDIRTEYRDTRNLISIAVLPNPNDDSVAEPFVSLNTTFALYSIFRYSDLAILFDNCAIDKMIRTSPEFSQRTFLGFFRSKRKCSRDDRFIRSNRLIANFLSCFVSPYLRRSTPSIDFEEVRVLMGSEGFNLMIPSMGNIKLRGNFDLFELATNCFDRAHVLFDLDADQYSERDRIIKEISNAYMFGLSRTFHPERLQLKTRLKAYLGQRFPEVWEFSHIHAPISQVVAVLKSRSIARRLNYHVQEAKMALYNRRPVVQEYVGDWLSIEQVEDRVQFVDSVLNAE